MTNFEAGKWGDIYRDTERFRDRETDQEPTENVEQRRQGNRRCVAAKTRLCCFRGACACCSRCTIGSWCTTSNKQQNKTTTVLLKGAKDRTLRCKAIQTVATRPRISTLCYVRPQCSITTINNKHCCRASEVKPSLHQIVTCGPNTTKHARVFGGSWGWQYNTEVVRQYAKTKCYDSEPDSRQFTYNRNAPPYPVLFLSRRTMTDGKLRDRQVHAVSDMACSCACLLYCLGNPETIPQGEHACKLAV